MLWHDAAARSSQPNAIALSRRGPQGEGSTPSLLHVCLRITAAGLDQLGIQCDCGVEDLGDRAVLLGLSRHFRELGFVKVRHLGTQRESGATDAEALALRLYGDRGLGGELSRGITAGLQP